MTIASPLAAALDRAVRHVRTLAGDPLAAVAIVTPTRANAQLAFRAYASGFPSIRVTFEPADALIDRLGRHALRTARLRAAPVGFAEAALRAALDAEPPSPDPIAATRATVRRPAWLAALARAADTLDRAGVGAAELAALPPTLDPHQRDLLAWIVRTVSAAREAARVRGAGDVARAAEALLRDAASVPEHLRLGGVVTLGDGALARSSFDALRALFAAVPVAHVAVPPFDALPPAPLGLRAAAPEAALIIEAGAAAGERALGALQRREAAALDGSVVFAATADEAREITEAVRVVSAAIRRGTPLDRIAIALPDPATVSLLAEALGRAHIDATWLVGPPLAQTPPGRLLTGLLALHGGSARARDWYGLLRTPGLMRSPLLAPLAPVGRSRWRRLLGEANAAPDTATLLRDLARRRDALGDPASPEAGGVEGEGDDAATAEEIARERAALASLHAVIEAVQHLADGLPAIAPLGAHGRGWRAALDSLVATPSAASRQLERVLEGFGPGDVGAPLGRADAGALLSQALTATQALEGALSDPAVRVVPPMALLGADVDLVCVLGLNEGRFPREISDDPLLPDAVIAALDVGREAPRLVPASALADAERRRFFAAVSAPRRELWLSAPRSELMEARPAVPSALLLEALGTLRGERIGYTALGATAIRVGGRDVFHPGDARAAVSASEALLARVSAGREAARGPGAAPAALDALRTHPWASRVARLYRAIERLHRPIGGAAPAVDAWSGRVDPTGLSHPADGSAPVASHVLAEAIASQSAYFLTRVLGAWRPKWLRDPGLASSAWAVNRWVVAAITRAAEASPEDPASALGAALDEVIAEERALPGDAAGADVAVARALAEARLAALRAEDPRLVPGPRARFSGDALTDDAPWQLAGAGAHASAGRVVAWEQDGSKTSLSRHPERALRAGLEALALARRDGTAPQAAARAANGEEIKAPPAEVVAARVSEAWARVSRGVWLVEGALALHHEAADPTSRSAPDLEVLAGLCFPAPPEVDP